MLILMVVTIKMILSMPMTVQQQSTHEIDQQADQRNQQWLIEPDPEPGEKNTPPNLIR